jgi:hypothetical protein
LAAENRIQRQETGLGRKKLKQLGGLGDASQAGRLQQNRFCKPAANTTVVNRRFWKEQEASAT